jgi:hypothetical protein
MNQIVSRLFTASFLTITLAGIAFADPITAPPGVPNGTIYRLAFITSTTTTASSTDINYYNNFVTTLANSVAGLAALNTTWEVIGSTAAVSAINNTQTTGTGVPIYLLNGTELFASYTAMWNGTTPFNAFNVNETGTLSAGYQQVWTGTTPSGNTSSGGNSGSLGSPGGGYVIMGNNTTENSSYWINCCIAGYTQNKALFAISTQEFVDVGGVATSVPEPASIVLAPFALVALGFVARKRKSSAASL